MILSDIVTLAKAGFTVADIKELMKTPEEPEKKEEVKQEEPEKKEEPKQEEPVKKEEPDYKSMYEQAKADLAKAQAVNVNKDISEKDKVSDEDRIKDLISSFI